MDLTASLRSLIKAARRRGAPWVRVIDVARLLFSGEGRGQLLTRLIHRGKVHQTTPYTAHDRYPALFDFSAALAPGASRILSFGCSTGEELIALRRRFAAAEIVGVEINPRSRAIARRRTAADSRTLVVRPRDVSGSFDVIFALAVLQREPHKIAEMGIEDMSALYPFARFDAAVGELVGRLRDGGLMCVANAQYRVVDSSVAARLQAVSGAPTDDEWMFDRDGRRLERAAASTIFRKLPSDS